MGLENLSCPRPSPEGKADLVLPLKRKGEDVGEAKGFPKDLTCVRDTVCLLWAPTNGEGLLAPGWDEWSYSLQVLTDRIMNFARGENQACKAPAPPARGLWGKNRAWAPGSSARLSPGPVFSVVVQAHYHDSSLPFLGNPGGSEF